MAFLSLGKCTGFVVRRARFCETLSKAHRKALKFQRQMSQILLP